MSRIVILGADGFIGRHLVTKLAEDRSNTVVAFDRFSAYQTGSDRPFENYANVEVVPGNFFNREDLAAVLHEKDYVFHLVSTTNPATSNSDPFIDIDTNVRGSLEFLEICTENKVRKVIFLSSGGTVYGDISSDKIHEQTVPQPRSPYAIGKLTIEYYLRYFKFTHGLDYIVYRVANPYGPGQNIYGKQGVIPIFMNKYRKKEPIIIFGDGTMVRDYLYIEDLADMITETYAKDHAHDEYNAGSGRGVSVNELVRAIEECTGFSVEKKFHEAPPTYIHKSVLDTKRFSKEFNVVPRVDLREGIKKTWEFVKSLE